MKVAVLDNIKNFYAITERVGTAGQPSEAELAEVAAAGYQVVINLAMHGADYSLPDERAAVESLGMKYIHLPVVWQSPQPENLRAFCAAMEANQDRKVFVHCAANMRVSAFMALYRIIYHNLPPDQAFSDMKKIWNPEGAWKNFIDQILSDPDLARQI